MIGRISLRAARVIAGMTLADVAKEMKTSKNTLIKWEKGEVAPRVDKFKQLCSLYGFDFADIIMPGE
jgi:transcriptional regulator with XRE-family HTH domain